MVFKEKKQLFKTYILWPLSIEGSLHVLWHRTSVYNSYLLGPVKFTPILPSIGHWSRHCLFDDLGPSRQGFDHLTCGFGDERSNWLCHGCGLQLVQDTLMTLKICFLYNHCNNSTKLVTKHPWVKGSWVCLIKEPHPLS